MGKCCLLPVLLAPVIAPKVACSRDGTAARQPASALAWATQPCSCCCEGAGFITFDILSLKVGLVLFTGASYELGLFATLVARRLGAPRRLIVALWVLGMALYTGKGSYCCPTRCNFAAAARKSKRPCSTATPPACAARPCSEPAGAGGGAGGAVCGGLRADAQLRPRGHVLGQPSILRRDLGCPAVHIPAVRRPAAAHAQDGRGGRLWRQRVGGRWLLVPALRRLPGRHSLISTGQLANISERICSGGAVWVGLLFAPSSAQSAKHAPARTWVKKFGTLGPLAL